MRPFVALVALFLCCAAVAEARFRLPRGEFGPEDSDGDLAEYLASKQFLARGRLVEIAPVRKPQVGGCGAGVRGPFEAYEITVAVDSVLVGRADDSLVVVTTVGQGMLAPELAPNRPVFVWGFRNCVDGWKLYGDAIGIKDDGSLVQWSDPYRSLSLRTSTGVFPATQASLLQRLDELSPNIGSTMITRGTGIAAARIAKREMTKGGMVCEVDTSRTVYGTGILSVKRVTLGWTNGCFYNVDVGDWVLLPIDAAPESEEIALDVCPYSILVKDGFVPGLGVPVDRIESVLAHGPKGIVIRQFAGSERSR